MKITLLITLIFISNIFAGTVTGKWKTIDDETGKTKSIVEITEENGKLYGSVVKVFPKPGASDDPICKKGEKKGQKIIGMRIIEALEKDDERWEGDDAIFDPEKGKFYDCEIWLESENKLAVRGYIGFLFRTQIWVRVK